MIVNYDWYQYEKEAVGMFQLLFRSVFGSLPDLNVWLPEESTKVPLS
jgi:hypothetical protein